MNGVESALWSIRRTDHFAELDTPATRIDPRAKVLAVFTILLAVASQDPHTVSALLPLLLFPVFLLSRGEVPLRWLAVRLLVALPFVLFVGIFNPWLDRRPVAAPWGGEMAAGWLTFPSIMLRFVIVASAAFLLVATTGVTRIAKALSRLLLLLTGLLLAQEGEIRFGAAQVNKKFIPELRRHVGIVFENPDNQLFMPTVFEDLPCGPLNMCMSPEDVRAVTLRALKTVGASHLDDRPPWQLSSGETRAVAIAGVPAMHPDILILDEPSNALDPGARRRLIRLLQTIEHTKIIATHDLDLVLDGCSRVIVLNQGRILADAPPLQIFSDETLLATASLEKPLSLQRRDCSGASRGFNQRRDWGGQVV